MSASNHRVAAWVAASAAALALGIAACGDSDSDDEGAKVAATTPATNNPADQKAVVAVMVNLRKRYNAIDGAGFCSLLTAAGRREMGEFGLSLQPSLRTDKCAKAVNGYAGALVPKGGRHTPVRIKSVSVSGDNATVTLNGGLAGIRSIATYKLAKENGAWKVADPVSGAETRKLPKKFQ